MRLFLVLNSANYHNMHLENSSLEEQFGMGDAEADRKDLERRFSW